MKTTYKLTSSKLNGHFIINFENDRLKGFEIAFKQQLTVAQFTYFISKLPYNEEGLKAYEQLGLTITRTAAPNQKIALFCSLYEKHVGIKYKVSPSDSGKIKHVDITEQLLHHYFRSENFLWKGKYSIANLVKYYNELRADMVQGGKPRHPDEWDKAYFARLPVDQHADYFRHLREQGLKAIKAANGSILDWR